MLKLRYTASGEGNFFLHAVLRYFNLPEKNFPAAAVTEQVAIFRDHLETFLSENWKEWLTACECVEKETVSKLSKNQLAYRTATLRAGAVVPEMLLQILAKVKE